MIFQFSDRVTTPEGDGMFWGVWPDGTLYMVKMDAPPHRIRSFDKHRVHLTEVSTIMQRCEQAIAEAFGIQEAAE